VNEFGESQRSLIEAYQSWRDLTVRERAALQNNDWIRVTECQSAKNGLQFRILCLREDTQQESALLSPAASQFEHQVRTLLTELISAEKSNIELIQSWRRSAEVQKKELDRRHMILGKVHRTYGNSSDTCWSSYS
jgi:hypothetical protein